MIILRNPSPPPKKKKDHGKTRGKEVGEKKKPQAAQDKKPQPKQMSLPKAQAKAKTQSSHDAMAQLFEAQAAVMRSLASPS